MESWRYGYNSSLTSGASRFKPGWGPLSGTPGTDLGVENPFGLRQVLKDLWISGEGLELVPARSTGTSMWTSRHHRLLYIAGPSLPRNPPGSVLRACQENGTAISQLCLE